MWIVEATQNIETLHVKTEFSLYYEADDESESQVPLLYKCIFDLNNFLVSSACFFHAVSF